MGDNKCEQGHLGTGICALGTGMAGSVTKADCAWDKDGRPRAEERCWWVGHGAVIGHWLVQVGTGLAMGLVIHGQVDRGQDSPRQVRPLAQTTGGGRDGQTKKINRKVVIW